MLLNVKLKNKRLVADDVYAFELVESSGWALPSFTAGAHIDVHLPVGIIRQYSLCNDPGETHRYMIGVLRDPQSRGGSVAMHGLDVGTQIQISRPRNLFELSKEAKHSVLIAGGIGITPLLSMAEHLSTSGESFELHYCARSSSKMAFSEQLQNFRFASHLSLHFDDGPVEQRFDALKVFDRRSSDSVHAYVCGPNGFIEYVISSARTAGYDERQIHREHFGPLISANDEDRAFSVQLASTGEVYRVEIGETVVSALAKRGVEILVSCEQGICGTCITGVVTGIPLHRDLFLTEEEHEANDQFTPCCSRSCSPVLVLDL